MKHQHWADIYAEKIIRERTEIKDGVYTCASGITPSGTVHIGNFREIISVDLVVRALRDKGVKTRFVYSWDDFDVFRKVPENVPNTKEFERYLRMPITDIPDPFNREDNYALGNERGIESILSGFGIAPEYLYQAKKYRKGEYAEKIQKALIMRGRIREIMNKFRTSPLSEDWWPISLFSSFSKKDTTTIVSWDGEWNITYYCEESQQEETIDIRTSKNIKLFWRIDWPMRWEYEKVVFEPAGKDHHTQGGSFDTAKAIVQEVYDFKAPVTFQYGFVQIKGGSGKISSSSGEVVSISDVLEIYQPEIVRYLFSGTRPNAEFAISFDIDVIKIYEDYDRCERIYFGKEEVGESRKEKESRIYELSQTHGVPDHIPFQFPIRHLCNVLQIYGGDMEAVFERMKESYLGFPLETQVKTPEDLFKIQKPRLLQRMHCAWNWITCYAPEDFRFSLRNKDELSLLKESEEEQKAIKRLREMLLKEWDSITHKEVNSYIYEVARSVNMSPIDFFTTIYRRIIAKEKGPRLGTFLRILGKDIVDMYFSI